MTALAQRDGVRVVAFNKCGHTSIINTFMSPREGFQNPQPATIASSEIAKVDGYRCNLLDDEWRSWPEPEFIVSFLRDPVQRIISAHQHFCVRKERYKFKELGFKFGMSFPEFVDHLLTVDISADPHLSPCIDDLFTVSGDDKHCILAPLENIQEAWPQIMAVVGLVDVPREVYHKNKGEYDLRTTSYGQDLHDKIRELYREDYALWEAVKDAETRTTISPVHNSSP
jgi:hypothetical protein